MTPWLWSRKCIFFKNHHFWVIYVTFQRSNPLHVWYIYPTCTWFLLVSILVFDFDYDKWIKKLGSLKCDLTTALSDNIFVISLRRPRGLGLFSLGLRPGPRTPGGWMVSTWWLGLENPGYVCITTKNKYNEYIYIYIYTTYIYIYYMCINELMSSKDWFLNRTPGLRFLLGWSCTVPGS